MSTPVLKVGKYRGVRIYIRKLARETFEYLIPMDGELFCNQVEIQREAGSRMSAYSEEDTESAVTFLIGVGQDFIDDRLFQKKEYRRWKNRLVRIKAKVGNYLFHRWYKITEYYDNVIKRKSKGLRGYAQGVLKKFRF